MGQGLGVTDAVGLVHDYEVKVGRRVEVEESFVRLTVAAPGAVHERVVNKGIGEDYFGELLGPDALHIQLVDGVAEVVAIHVNEVFVEAAHFELPLALREGMLRSNDENGANLAAGLEFAEDEAG